MYIFSAHLPQEAIRTQHLLHPSNDLPVQETRDPVHETNDTSVYSHVMHDGKSLSIRAPCYMANMPIPQQTRYDIPRLSYRLGNEAISTSGPIPHHPTNYPAINTQSTQHRTTTLPGDDQPQPHHPQCHAHYISSQPPPPAQRYILYSIAPSDHLTPGPILPAPILPPQMVYPNVPSVIRTPINSYSGTTSYSGNRGPSSSKNVPSVIRTPINSSRAGSGTTSYSGNRGPSPSSLLDSLREINTLDPLPLRGQRSYTQFSNQKNSSSSNDYFKQSYNEENNLTQKSKKESSYSSSEGNECTSAHRVITLVHGTQWDGRMSRFMKQPSPKEKLFIYYMRRELRSMHNHVLAYIYKRAIKSNTPLIVYTNEVHNDSQRRRCWRIGGLIDVLNNLAGHRITLISETGEDFDVLRGLFKHFHVVALITDLYPGIKQEINLAKITAFAPSHTAILIGDGHNQVPVWVVHDRVVTKACHFRKLLRDKESTNRYKFYRLPEELSEPCEPIKGINTFDAQYPGAVVRRESCLLRLMEQQTIFDTKELEELDNLPPIIIDLPGEKRAQILLASMLNNDLKGYHRRSYRLNPLKSDLNSTLGLYVDHGFISTQYIRCKIEKSALGWNEKRAWISDVLSWREQADNFVFYANSPSYSYDISNSWPAWATASIDAAKDDPREKTYTFEQVMRGETHDELWNCIHKDMLMFGKLHSYSRLYWIKSLARWFPTMDEALKVAHKLNKLFAIDADHPGSFYITATALGGLHDRPFPNRPITGRVRIISANGVERFINVQEYQTRIQALWTNYTEKQSDSPFNQWHQALRAGTPD